MGLGPGPPRMVRTSLRGETRRTPPSTKRCARGAPRSGSARRAAPGSPSRGRRACTCLRGARTLHPRAGLVDRAFFARDRGDAAKRGPTSCGGIAAPPRLTLRAPRRRPPDGAAAESLRDGARRAAAEGLRDGARHGRPPGRCASRRGTPPGRARRKASGTVRHGEGLRTVRGVAAPRRAVAAAGSPAPAARPSRRGRRAGGPRAASVGRRGPRRRRRRRWRRRTCGRGLEKTTTVFDDFAASDCGYPQDIARPGPARRPLRRRASR